MSWFGRWEDPITGKTHDTNLKKIKVTSEETRRDWAIKKAQELAELRQAVSVGRVSKDGSRDVNDAVEAYLTGTCSGLRTRTVASYRESLEIFEEWAGEIGLRDLASLTPPLLHRFRAWLIARPRQRQRVGGKRGEWTTTADRRSATVVNRDLRQIKTFLTSARRHGIAPRVDAESVKENLASVRGELERPAFLRPAELVKLLKAVTRHDAQCFEMTRDEKARGRARETPRHPPIAPLVLTALLTGCRINELLTLPWDAVLLDGRGELIISARVAKTARARAVDLGICPSLVQLLTRMQLTAGSGRYVFGSKAPLRREIVESARRRLVTAYAAPAFSWQRLRQTCATYSMNAAALFGTAGAFQSARRLGHSVGVAESRYAGLLSDLPREARTLEDAMSVKDLAEGIALEGRLPAREAV